MSISFSNTWEYYSTILLKIWRYFLCPFYHFLLHLCTCFVDAVFSQCPKTLLCSPDLKKKSLTLIEWSSSFSHHLISWRGFPLSLFFWLIEFFISTKISVRFFLSNTLCWTIFSNLELTYLVYLYFGFISKICFLKVYSYLLQLLMHIYNHFLNSFSGSHPQSILAQPLLL